MILYKCHNEVLYMAKKEKISEYRRKLIKEFMNCQHFLLYLFK